MSQYFTKYQAVSFGYNRAQQIVEGSSAPTAADIAKLAVPQNFADAMSYIQFRLRGAIHGLNGAADTEQCRGLIPMVLERHADAVRPLRVALRTGAISNAAQEILPHVDCDVLRELASAEDAKVRAGARLALCILCEPPSTWSDLTDKERAGALLGELCQAVRNRPVS